MERIGARFQAAPIQPPSVRLLSAVRAGAAERAIAAHRNRALKLAAAMDAGEEGAAESYGELVETAFASMRRDVLANANGPIARLLAHAHRRFGDTDETEHLDNPDLDPAIRVRLLEYIDSVNQSLGTYRTFFDAMQPLFASQRTTRILDVGAGHGGFALEVARIAKREGMDVEITASDLRREYLDIGQAVAEREGLNVNFAVQDALDLSNFGVGEFDIIVCTQSIHHFSASMNARMFRQAARIAGRGVVFIDGCRSISIGVLLIVFSTLRFPDRRFAHDTWTTLRRFYVPEELSVVAKLGPEAETVESEWLKPGYCLLRWRRPTSDRAASSDPW